MFPNGSPVNSTFHNQNDNFIVCGQIVVSSLIQDRSVPCFLEDSVFDIMVNTDVDIKTLSDQHLTASDLQFIQPIKAVIGNNNSRSYRGHCQFCDYKYRNEKGGVSERIHGRTQIV